MSSIVMQILICDAHEKANEKKQLVKCQLKISFDSLAAFDSYRFGKSLNFYRENSLQLITKDFHLHNQCFAGIMNSLPRIIFLHFAPSSANIDALRESSRGKC